MYLTCDFQCVWLVGVDVDLPGSCLYVSVKTDSPQVAHCFYGPQFTGGLIAALAHTWNLLSCSCHKYLSHSNNIVSKKKDESLVQTLHWVWYVTCRVG